MKKNLFLSITNWILAFSIPLILLTTEIKENTIKSNLNIKNLNTNLFQKIVEVTSSDKSTLTSKQDEKEEKVDIEELEIKDINEDINIDTNVNEEKVPISDNKTENNVVVKDEQETVVPSYTTYTGKVSYYTANCYGCGGYTSSGLDISDGRLFYNDAIYGNVRIIAAGKEIPLYSIVRINNSSLGTNILAIVLDRGGDIGDNKKFIIDILTNDAESKGGVDYGVSVEVLRNGK